MARGVTLIETLVVLVLLGMLAGVGAVALVGTGVRASVMDAYASVLDIDGKARSVALNGGHVIVRVHEHRIELQEVDRIETLATRTVNPSLSLHFFDEAGFERISTLRFDSRGHTDDYQLSIRPKGKPGSHGHWAISGLTGWSEPMP